MSTMERGKDAQDQAPKSTAPQAGAEPASKAAGDGKNGAGGQDKAGQEAPNYETTDRGQAIELEDMSSANDEGAN